MLPVGVGKLLLQTIFAILEGEPHRNVHRMGMKVKIQTAAFFGRKVVILASKPHRNAWFGSELGDLGSINPFM